MSETAIESVVRVRSLGSGSSGNALLVEYQGLAILIDAGLGPRVLAQAMAQAGVSPTRLAAVLVSHEHGDHVRALPHLFKRGVPIYASEGTSRALGGAAGRVRHIGAGASFEIAGIEVKPIAVSHDAAEPLGFWMRAGSARIVIATDLGEPSTEMQAALANAELVVLESNHDVEMLRLGPYPIHLKRRVASKSGHLSNADCSWLLANALRNSPSSREVWLAHLSETNNRPALAETAARDALAGAKHPHRISALPRYGSGPVWTSTPVETSNQLRLLDI